MTHGRLLLALLMVGWMLAVSAKARTVDATGATPCDTVGYAIDRDPKGTNIRSAPRGDAPVIGRLQPLDYPAHEKSAGVLVGQTFRIIGAKGGWLLIRDVDPQYDRQNKPYGGFAGPGWVLGQLVGLQLAAVTLRAAPSHEAPVIARLQGET